MNGLHEEQQPRYMEYLAFLYYLGTFFFIGRCFPMHRMVWFSFFISAILAGLLLYVYYLYLTKHKIGRWVLLCTLLISIFIGCFSIYCFSDFFHTCVLNDTPIWLFPLAFLLVCVGMARKDIYVLELFSRILGPVVLFFLLLANCSSISKIESPYTHGFLTFDGFIHPSGNSFWVSTLLFFVIYFAEGFVLLTLLSLRKKSPSVFKDTAKGLFLSVILLATTYLVTVLALGPEVFELLTYPIYYPPGLTQTAEYLERIEVILLAVFVFSEFLKFSLLLMMCREAISFIYTAFSNNSIEKTKVSYQWSKRKSIIH